MTAISNCNGWHGPCHSQLEEAYPVPVNVWVCCAEDARLAEPQTRVQHDRLQEDKAPCVNVLQCVNMSMAAVVSHKGSSHWDAGRMSGWIRPACHGRNHPRNVLTKDCYTGGLHARVLMMGTQQLVYPHVWFPGRHSTSVVPMYRIESAPCCRCGPGG